MRILTFTTLYPNAAAPHHGVFVENRMRAFADRTGAEIRVVAPLPWFPTGARWAGRYGAYARAPLQETRRGFEISHPRYAIPPKVGMTYAAAALERCFMKEARRLLGEGWDFDLIDAHYLYPDGVAAVRAARRLGKPVVITARGTDVNFIPKFPRQRAMILQAVRDADAIIAVAGALKEELVRLGAPSGKIEALRNGVDLDMFRPLDRTALRRAMALDGDVIASVGGLNERKGHHLVIEALKALPGATLLIAGEGEERGRLERLASEAGVAGRVRFLGAVAHDRLIEVYGAADALALASSREGWPNVLLEAMACGTPAVATPVWGSREVIGERAAGLLAADRSAPAMASALAVLLKDRPDRAETRQYAERFSWNETSDGLDRVFKGAIGAARAGTAAVRPISVAADRARPRLIITVDTEEEFDWSRFDGARRAVSAPGHIDGFQALARSFGAAPVYFLTHPVIADPASSRYFRTLSDEGAASLGLHLHQWATPPANGFDGEYYSFQRNLPTEVHREKLGRLADAFESAFGFRARSHRAGRYGVSAACYEALAEVGVDLDFSPSPAFDFSAAGGPDFSGAGNAPFWIEPRGRSPVAVTPVCGAHGLRGSSAFLSRAGAPIGFGSSPRSPARALTAPMRLTCEGVTLKDLVALTRRLIADGTPVLTFSLHSTTMTPGGNPYAADAAGAAAALALSRRYFEFFVSDLGGEILSLEALGALYGLPRR